MIANRRCILRAALATFAFYVSPIAVARAPEVEEEWEIDREMADAWDGFIRAMDEADAVTMAAFPEGTFWIVE